ncbi:alpha/beta hydrolase [Avibacterium paragallinarum]|uniref:alpha/beta hydrolase n=1 Tax=Avibacterium paragallinarum TaxID=728 RepID=UPI0009E447A3|nr:alpha/beta hydrolase [Avibacterium paragallinarum]AZI13701.1 alpha/beta hydrolase [Avibacterium paragallinarum]QIR11983.1 alpha/beta hydrolase [Avibacterium paragallinarum]QJE09197.1 alpha/beta hydrolase [Avibacterium paragallinarum]QJE11393.1 alpha/beta hydrolase [Avibacterium paragallinarum]QJE13591.1 alpha/beta hydrolase [Avibacterium paragallinarum]
MKFKPLFTTLLLSTTLLGGNAMAQNSPLTHIDIPAQHIEITQEWDKIFPQSDKVHHHKVAFANRYGITLVGDLYIPKNAKGKLPAIAVSGPFGAVKEQVSGLYAQTLAERGFVTLAFDPSYTGESGGTPRNMASPDVNTEDFSTALEYLGLQNFVDRNRLGVLGICGLGGMALNDAAMDTRVKAVATSVMYDMSRSIGWGVGDQKNGYTPEQRQIVKTYLNNLRWADAESGERAIGLHEVVLDPNNNVVPIQQGLPDELPANANPVLAQFHNFYKTQRGYHPRSINSTTAWTATMPLSFVNIPMMSYISEISPRPMLIVTGENAHSRYMAEEAYQAGKIPFDTFADFFKKHL